MRYLREQTVCFTGHRNIPPECISGVSERLNEQVIKLIEDGYRFFGAGGALGFDTIAAQTIIKLREQFPHIRLILVLPCLSQAASWSTKDQEIYEEIKQRADKIVFTSEHYFRGCMQKRNRHLVDNSSICVCYLTENTGGTAYTVRYAQTKGLRIENIAK